MITQIRNLAVALIALVTFVVIGADLVNSFGDWECDCTHIECRQCEDEFTWVDFHMDAFEEAADEFTALFNSYETKRAKNGAMMIRQGDSGSFKFAKKG
jgi:hypothetical protein